MRCDWKVEEAIKELQKHLQDYEDELYALEHLKKATKKDGKPFARLSDNYPEAKIDLKHCWIDGSIEGIELYGGFGKKSVYGRKFHRIVMYFPQGEHKESISFEDVESLIAKETKRASEQCDNYKKQLKVARKAFAKIDNIATKLIDCVKSIEEANDAPYYSSLGYALIKYAKEIL